MSNEIKNKPHSSIENQTDEHKVFETVEEQALHRPGMWIGSTTNKEKELYLYSEDGFESKNVDFNDGIAKLIEEVIVNSADEHVRSKANPKLRGWVLDKIKVTVSPDGKVSVWDNGGISIYKHTTLGTYSLENIFGKLFSSSNYEDNKTRETVGTNGVGASLANLFSTEFTASTADGKQHLEICWQNNKSIKHHEILTDVKDHWTLIEYQLELSRFDLEEIPFGVIKYIEKLCMILSASYPGLEVTFNDEVFKFASFKDYVKLYGDEIILGEKNEQWEIYVAPTFGDAPRRLGIVNGAECNSGTHIKMGIDRVNFILNEQVTKEKNKAITALTSQQMASSYHVYINITVDKTKYTSQAKTELTNDLMWFDEKENRKRLLKVSPKVSKEIILSDIYTYLKELAEQKENAINSKAFKDKAKQLNAKSAKHIRKLLDAGATKSSERKLCELWIFEGESAASGFRTSRYDSAYQGSYLLKGKSMNTADMSTIKILANQEFADIVVALGLNVANPSDLSKLRYGKIILCTDMDYDGDSIIGQLLTLFAIHFPDLLKTGMIYRAISPLYKAVKNKETKYFMTNEEFYTWQNSSGTRGYEIFYFKGIGSLEKSDYKELLWNTKLQRFELDDKTMYMIGTFMKKAPQHKKELKKILKDRTKIAC